MTEDETDEIYLTVACEKMSLAINLANQSKIDFSIPLRLLRKAEKVLIKLRDERGDLYELFLGFYSLARAKVI